MRTCVGIRAGSFNCAGDVLYCNAGQSEWRQCCGSLPSLCRRCDNHNVRRAWMCAKLLKRIEITSGKGIQVGIHDLWVGQYTGHIRILGAEARKVGKRGGRWVCHGCSLVEGRESAVRFHDAACAIAH